MVRLRFLLFSALLFGAACSSTAFAAGTCPVPMLMWGTSGSAPDQLQQPVGVDIGEDGYVYVADQHNERVQVFTDTGSPMMNWAIPPGPNGFAYPTGICVKNGVVWVSANQGQHVTRWTTSGGFLGYVAVPPGGWNYPVGIACDPSGITFYVCDDRNSRVAMFNASGAFLGQFSTGWEPYGVDVDAAGHVFVGTYGDHRVYRYSTTGVFQLFWGGFGSGPGQFYGAEGITHDSAGNIYVCDTGNDRVQKFTPDGAFLCEFGGNGTGLGEMDAPDDIAIDRNGDLYLCEFVNNRVQRWTLGAVPTQNSTWGAIKTRYR